MAQRIRLWVDALTKHLREEEPQDILSQLKRYLLAGAVRCENRAHVVRRRVANGTINPELGIEMIGTFTGRSEDFLDAAADAETLLQLFAAGATAEDLAVDLRSYVKRCRGIVSYPPGDGGNAHAVPPLNVRPVTIRPSR